MRKLFLLSVAIFAVTALWAYDFQSGNLYYNITSSSAPYTVEVTYEKQYASTNYKGLTTANIPKLVTHEEVTYSVTGIVEGAFYDCSSLTSITIPNSITSIGAYAFYNCYFLTSITIPNSVTSIGYVAFGNCESLTSITIPNSVTSIESGTFSGCSSLTSVTIPNSVTSIGAQAFSGCSSLTSITLPNSITSIEDNVFYACESLTSITIPNSVTSIGNGAFMYCSSLTSITIPNSVTFIGEYAFYRCSALSTVICKAVNVPNMRGDVFYDVPQATATLYVPAESLDLYKSAEQWKEFGTIMPIIAENYNVIFYDYDGTILSEQNVIEGNDAIAPADPVREGYTFVGWGRKFTNITASAVVIAQYEKEQQQPVDGIAVVYQDGVDFSIVATEKVALNIPEAPIHDGYTFEAWKISSSNVENGILVIATYTEEIPFDVNNVSAPSASPQKIVRDNQVLILRDGKTYNTMGAEVK